jgi:plasmid stability protein
MRQLITRIDDKLHARLKARAAAEGRSVNSLVTDLLADGLSGQSGRDRLREQIEAAGLRVVVPPPPPRGRRLSREEVIDLTRGWGTAVTEALDADRARR